MFFTVTNKYNTNEAVLKIQAKFDAKTAIMFFPMGTAEQVLDKYCHEHYKKSLKSMCLHLVQNLTWGLDNDGNIIGTFKDKKLDKIAALITYGTHAMYGSKILRQAFSA